MEETFSHDACVIHAPFPVALFVLKDDKLLLRAMSEEAGEILSCSKEDFHLIEGEQYLSYIHPDDAKELISFIPMLIEMGRLSFAARCKKFGKRSYEWVSGYLKHDSNDTDEQRFLMFFYTQEDIDFLDHQSWLQRDTGKRLIMQDIIDAVNVPIFWKDKARRYLGANRAFLDYLGYSDESEIIGKTNEALGIGAAQNGGALEERMVLSGESFKKNATIFAKNEQRAILLNEEPIVKSRKVIGLIGSFRDITEEVARTEELEHLANRDELTGSHNRRSFFKWLHERQKEYIEGGDDFAVVMMDMDDFKEINDNYGHEAGDRVLIRFANRIKNCRQKGEHLFRLGGDEFVMIIEHLNKEKLPEIQERLRKVVEEPMDIDGIEMSVRISMGYATYSDSLDIDLLMRQADMSMYEDKKRRKAGR